jgi:hypothetical protein
MILLILARPQYSSAQGLDSLPLTWQSDIASICQENTVTMQEDILNRGFLYVAAKEGGLKIYNIKNPKKPIFVDQVKDSESGVMNIHQNGYFLYLSMGDYFNTKQAPGLTIVDVSDPEKPVVRDEWKYGTKTEGAGMIVTNGDYAYMAAMAHGLITLNIKDKNNISLESALVPDSNFPKANPDLTKINARGLVYNNGLIYLAYDAGGVRIIDVKDPKKPMERGKYSNPQLNGRPRAYNNVVYKENQVYVTFDYCGMEVLDVSDTASISLTSWWNPWGCPNNNWFTSTGHTNEIAIDTACDIVFMSTGKSEMYVVDISDPKNPDSIATYGAIDNKLGTWGVSRFKNRVYMSYICTLGIPFQGTWSGVKILSYESECTKTNDLGAIKQSKLTIAPNPVEEFIRIPAEWLGSTYSLMDATGRLLLKDKVRGQVLNMKHLSSGIYYLTLQNGESISTQKFSKK